MHEGSPPPPGIGSVDRSETPQAVRILVLVLQGQVVTLSERVSALEERTQRSSRNSSQPPSADPPSVPTPRKGKRSVRKQGGQRGQRGHGRPLMPPAQVDEVIEATPTAGGRGGQRLLGADPPPARQQVTAVPRVRPRVTE